MWDIRAGLNAPEGTGAVVVLHIHLSSAPPGGAGFTLIHTDLNLSAEENDIQMQSFPLFIDQT